VIIALKIAHMLEHAKTEDINATTGQPMSKGETQSFLTNQGRLAGLSRPALEREERLHPAEFPHFAVPKHNAPKRKKLAEGGYITSPGLVEVGERGPELLHLPRSAMVTPLSPSLRAPTMTEVRRTGGHGGGGDAPIHVHNHMTITMAGKPIAEGTNEVVARAGALA